MKRLSLHHGLYRHRTFFWWRPTIAGRRTWRRLSSTTETAARAELAALSTDHRRARLGLCVDPLAPRAVTFAELSELYQADRLAVTAYRAALERLRLAFGRVRIEDLTIRLTDQYAAGRGGKRAADMDLTILSAVLSWGVGRGLVVVNPLRGRRRCYDSAAVRHSRDCMPRDADELHALARRLLPNATGWQLLFAALTGCRTSELLSLRWDASTKSDPGFLEGNYLYVRRGKGGVFPYVELTPELRAAIEAHRRWHDGVSPWWLPGQDLFRPLSRFALTHALDRLGPPKRTAHGLRAYCVTVWRSRGESNEQVAARIGDRTAALIETTYGSLPECWAGGAALGWLPASGEPAWGTKPENVVEFTGVG